MDYVDGSKINDKCPYKRHTKERRGNVTPEIDWSDAATSPGKLQLREAGRGKASPPRAAGRIADTLT